MTDDRLMASLARIEKSIRASDGEAIKARWEFGRLVLAQRQGKQLPKDLGKKICDAIGISQKEMSNRTRVAEHYPEVSSELLSSGLTWTAIVNDLPKTRPTPKPPPKPRLASSPATIKEAHRVADSLTKPEVQAELLAMDKSRKGADKAQKAAEKAQKDAERRQLEEDQEKQQMMRVARQRLVAGDHDWENLSELTEIYADTVKRYLELIDGLAIPEQLRLKRLEADIGQLQQALLDLSDRLRQSERSSRVGVGHRAVINVEAR